MSIIDKINELEELKENSLNGYDIDTYREYELEKELEKYNKFYQV